MVSFRRRWDPKTESRWENEISTRKRQKEKIQKIRYNRITLKLVADFQRLRSFPGELHMHSMKRINPALPMRIK